MHATISVDSCTPARSLPATQKIKAGLGTSIVEALASRLDAEIHTTAGNPGIRISIVHANAAIGA
jgi:two-component sensor histidine kinase